MQLTTELKEKVEKKILDAGLVIDWVDYGIAARFGKTVVMNTALLQHEDYLWSVVDHEIRHSMSWSSKDLAMDLVEGDLWKNLKFCFRHPKALTQLIPFGIYKDSFYYDTNLIILYSVIFIGSIVIMSL